MKKFVVLCFVLCLSLAACVGSSSAPMSVDARAEVRGADVFNPWRNAKLPTSRQLSKDGTSILGAMGGDAQSIQGEAKHRRYWREEIYPIVYGSKGAPHEILVLLDFANPKSESLWQNVVAASRSLAPNDVKIVVFGKSSELYGTDLMGLLVWISHERKGQEMAYLSYVLRRWNEIKEAQRRQGRVKVFANEYDATASSSDLPILYSCIGRLRPPVAERDELALSRYSYDAGNINMYQARQVCSYFGVEPPCVLVDGTDLGLASTAEIVRRIGK